MISKKRICLNYIIYELIYLIFLGALLYNSILGINILPDLKNLTKIDLEILVRFGSRSREMYIFNFFGPVDLFLSQDHI